MILFVIHIFSMPSLARLLLMCCSTTTLGSAEVAVLLAYLTAKNLLPKKEVAVVGNENWKKNKSILNETTNHNNTNEINTTSSSSSTSPSVSSPRKFLMDHDYATSLLRLSFQIKRSWAQSLRRIYGIDMQFVDRNIGTSHEITPANGPYLFVHLNQNSLLESVLFPIVPSYPNSLLTNYEFTLIPFLGWCYYLTGVTIDRSNPVSARGGVDECVRQMKEEGRNFYMSVEGVRSKDGSLSQYKRGAAVIAIRSQATIVPIVSKGMRELLPFGDWRVREGSAQVIYEQ
jgi:1-acyl-sn-glycerol-3-phosphate acyltransferase